MQSLVWNKDASADWPEAECDFPHPHLLLPDCQIVCDPLIDFKEFKEDFWDNGVLLAVAHKPCVHPWGVEMLQDVV